MTIFYSTVGGIRAVVSTDVLQFVILVIGLGVIAVPTGLVASAMSEARHQIEREMDAEARQQTLVAEEPENAVVNRP